MNVLRSKFKEMTPEFQEHANSQIFPNESQESSKNKRTVIITLRNIQPTCNLTFLFRLSIS